MVGQDCEWSRQRDLKRRKLRLLGWATRYSMDLQKYHSGTCLLVPTGLELDLQVEQLLDPASWSEEVLDDCGSIFEHAQGTNCLWDEWEVQTRVDARL